MSNIVAIKKPATETLRKVDLVVIVEGQTSDDSHMAPLLVGALKDFIHAAPETSEGKFESRGELGVINGVRFIETPRHLTIADIRVLDRYAQNLSARLSYRSYFGGVHC